MKRQGLLLLVIATLFSCRNESVISTGNKADSTETIAASKPETSKNETVEAIVTDETETHTNYAERIDFKKFGTELLSDFTKAEIDWESYPDAKNFKTRINEAYKNDGIGFAGHYVTVVFGCGGGCILGFMVDVKDGKIYALPLGEENSCFLMDDGALHVPDSKLFISAVCKENAEATEVSYKAYLWNEETRHFEVIKAETFLKQAIN